MSARLVEREFLCTIPGADFEEPVYAATRAKARYRYWRRISDCCPDLPLIDVKVRVGAKPDPPSTEWKTLGLTEHQRELVRHSLGFDGFHKTSYRNHFVTGAGADSHDEWMELVQKGLAHHRQNYPLADGDDVFWCTKRLALAVRDSYEHLGKDFRE